VTGGVAQVVEHLCSKNEALSSIPKKREREKKERKKEGRKEEKKDGRKEGRKEERGITIKERHGKCGQKHWSPVDVQSN
jgi:hypothetical protein